jgi:hypothetical protein
MSFATRLALQSKSNVFSPLGLWTVGGVAPAGERTGSNSLRLRLPPLILPRLLKDLARSKT